MVGWLLTEFRRNAFGECGLVGSFPWYTPCGITATGFDELFAQKEIQGGVWNFLAILLYVNSSGSAVLGHLTNGLRYIDVGRLSVYTPNVCGEIHCDECSENSKKQSVRHVAFPNSIHDNGKRNEIVMNLLKITNKKLHLVRLTRTNSVFR